MHEATLSGLSILIVEDEALLRKQIGAHLEKQGADVTGADTLRAARGPCRCSQRATVVLPVPVSPWMRTGDNRSFIRLSAAMILSN